MDPTTDGITKSTVNEKASPGEKESPSRAEQTEHAKVEDRNIHDIPELPADKLNVIFENPLAGISREQLWDDVERFCRQYNLEDHLEDFKKGALVAQNPGAAQDLVELTDEEKAVLRREHTHKWHQPWQLYWLVGKSMNMCHSREYDG
jgi:hypothetical protein